MISHSNKVGQFSASLGQLLSGDPKIQFACNSLIHHFNNHPPESNSIGEKRPPNGFSLPQPRSNTHCFRITAHWPYYQSNCKEGWKIDTFYVSRKKKTKHSFVKTYHYFCQTLCVYHGGRLLRSIFEIHNFKSSNLNLILCRLSTQNLCFFPLEIHDTTSYL